MSIASKKVAFPETFSQWYPSLATACFNDSAQSSYPEEVIIKMLFLVQLLTNRMHHKKCIISNLQGAVGKNKLMPLIFNAAPRKITCMQQHYKVLKRALLYLMSLIESLLPNL